MDVIITAPTVEPVTVAQAKADLRISGYRDDTILASYLLAARQYTEEILGAALITQTWEAVLNRFRDPIKLKPPLQSVTSVKYIDLAGVEQTLDASIYQVRTELDAIGLDTDQVWPSTLTIYDAVRVRYVSGYGAAASNVPEPIRRAITLLAGHLYENREASSPLNINMVPMAYESLMFPYRRQWF